MHSLFHRSEPEPQSERACPQLSELLSYTDSPDHEPNLWMKLQIQQVQINYRMSLQKEPIFYGSCLISQQNNSQ